VSAQWDRALGGFREDEGLVQARPFPFLLNSQVKNWKIKEISRKTKTHLTYMIKTQVQVRLSKKNHAVAYVAPNMGTISLCERGSPYANILVIPARMHTGIPICMVISVCIILHMGIQDLISHIETISLCIRGSPYANIPAIYERTRGYAKNHLENR
jgi:hypothetical protein